MKAAEQYFAVVLQIVTLFKVVLTTPETVRETLS